MYKTSPLFIFLLFSFSVLRAQKEWVNWNSPAGGVTFKSGSGALYTNVPNNLKWPDYIGTRAYSFNDSLTGDMRFLTDGKSIWNKNYKCILNPKLDSLISCDDDFYKVQIVPFTDDHSKFYLFHLYSARGFVSQMDIGSPKGCADQNLSNLYYSVLQMNNDSGKLIASNIPILKNPLDRVTLIKHANKKDTWVIAHPWDSAYYAAFLITDAMVHQPVISVIGPPAFLQWSNIAGTITASPNGDIIATSSSNSTVEIYSFDNSTGILSNYKTINFPSEEVTSLCFSPDNTKLYIAVTDTKTCDDYSKIYQVDFKEHNLNKSLFMIKKYPRRILKLSKAPDNKVWIKVNRRFDVIEYPNQPKNAAITRERYLRSSSPVYFPNIVNDYIKQPAEKPIEKLNLPDTLKVCFGKAQLDVGAGYESYIWNTGDTGHSIEVTRPGLYAVLAGKKRFSKPDAYGYVYVKSTATAIFPADNLLFCPKTSHTLTIPQNITNIHWMDKDTSHIRPAEEGLYTLTGVDDKGCTVWDSVCVSIHNYPMVSFGNDTTLCSQQTLQLKMSSYFDSTNLRNIKSSTYKWQDNSTKNLFNVTKTGTYTGSVSYDGCTVSDTIQVNYIPMPKVDFGRDTSLCEGDSLKLFVEPFNVNYLWSNGSTLNTITAKATGNYWVKVSQQFCVNTDTILINFKPSPRISLPNDTVICAPNRLTLHPSASPIVYKYKWQNGDTTDKFIVTTTGSYSVAANLNGCYAADSVSIDVIAKPSLKLFDTILCKGEQLLLDPGITDRDTALWQDQSMRHTYLVTKSGIYSVSVTNKCGTDFKAINVVQKFCKLTMPSAFTPNSDKLNDLFRLKYPNIVKTIHFSVYNRMGKKIFETTDPYKGWDGTINGIPQPVGTYIWQINYTDIDNNKAFSSGYVVLIR
ncbi:MAG TPA: T9SS type B sorting domain-containing protein [Chitinophagaceae bacterium]